MKRVDIRQSDHIKIECIFYALSLILTRRYWFHSIASIKRLAILLLFRFLRYFFKKNPVTISLFHNCT